ncbi:hypothetical protein FA13DRAFT_1805550 [Coprinellus micaceus]|uniref:Uncharacterized protein n=1 Tax=Coprinellus micaceus TaxID=71717 RepID=A0A4Y7RZ28_COPMI|nr:hypothetical protein FA13DRAFT_1805550 [Coprinellus micaceus]
MAGVGLQQGGQIQSIRLVCTGDERNCNHLFRSIGPVGKLARLPEELQPAAFAHISRFLGTDDQTLPANVERRLSERGPRPSVRALHIDTDFASADPLKPGGDTRLCSENSGGKPCTVNPRDTEGIDSRELTSVNTTTSLGPWSIDKTYNLLDETLTCSSTSAHLKIDVTANVSAFAGVAVVAQGTIIPSVITYIHVTATVANMNVNAAVHGCGVFKLGDMPLSLSVSPTARASGTTTAHLIPQLSLSLNSFDGLSTAMTYISLDAHATANLALHGSVVASNDHGAEEVALLLPKPVRRLAGASAHFFNLFDGSRDITLFNKNWQLLRKCYGSSARRSLWDARSYMERAFFERRALACPSTKQPDLVPVVSQAIISSGAKVV